jgi:VWFA-related protein
MLLCAALLLMAAVTARQPDGRAELTGINTTEYPQVVLTANVYDRFGLPQAGLTPDAFRLEGDVANQCLISGVENISDANLPFSTVLVIDVSDSMAGEPLASARAAAQEYIDTLRPGDSAAVIAFASTVRLVQDFTTDTELLRAAIDGLAISGQTALYQAASEALELGSNAPEPRKAVILLSDGAEFGGLSRVTPAELETAAQQLGVPVYTIGLGYGADRSFLQDIAETTTADYFESPTTDELESIYSALGLRLTSQYVITANCVAPADGTVYEGELVITVPDGEARAPVSLRTPIPVPVVQIAPLESETLTETTTFAISVGADDPLTSVTATIDGVETVLEGPPYSLTIDPYTLAPGDYTLTVRAVDDDGDAGSAELAFTVPLLPVQILVSGLEDGGTIDADTRVELTFVSQSPVVHVAVLVDERDLAHLVQQPFAFTIRPLNLTPGEHTLRLAADSADGAQGELTLTFTISDAPYQTATALAPTATRTPSPTSTATPSPSPTETPNATLTALFAAQTYIPITSTAEALLQAAGTGTAQAIDAATQSAFDAQNTQTALDTLATLDAQSTQAAVDTQSTASAQAAGTQAAGTEVAALATSVQSTSSASQQNTAQAQATRESLQATVDAAMSATAAAAQATAAASTQSAQSATMRANETAVQATAAAATQSAQSATMRANETAVQATAAAATQMAQSATMSANETATQAAGQTATAVAAAATSQASTSTADVRASSTADARATSNAVAREEMLLATRDALATNNAAAREIAQQTADARSTDRARSTATGEARITATAVQVMTVQVEQTAAAQARATSLAISNATGTAIAASLQTTTAQAQATETRSALETLVVQQQATLDARATATAFESSNRTGTAVFNATGTAQAAEQTGTAVSAETLAARQTIGAPGQLTATFEAQQTIDTRLAAVGLVTEEATSEIALQPTTGVTRTTTPQPTLVPVDATGQTVDATTTALGSLCVLLVIVAVIALAVYLVRRRRSAPPR